MERQEVTAARAVAKQLAKDAESLLGLVNMIGETSSRMEFYTFRKSARDLLRSMEQDLRNVRVNIPKPLTELPAGVLADWQERLDEAWRSSQEEEVWNVVTEAVESGPAAVERLRAALAHRGVDLDDLADDLGIELNPDSAVEPE